MSTTWPAIADMNSVIRVIKLLNVESMGNFCQSRTALYQRLVVKFLNLSMIQGQITHCLYIFCSVKICPHQFQNGVLVFLHTFNGWHTFDHCFPFPILPRGRSIEDNKVDSEAKAICIFICANSISTPCARLFLDSSK